MSVPPKILIIRLSSLGDILHVLPAFHALRAKFPDAAIDWLSADKSEFLLAAVRGIDKIHVLDLHSLLRSPFDRSAWRRFRAVMRALRARRYDLVIDFQGLLKTAALSLAAGARTRIGFSRDLVREPPAHWFYHQTLKKPAEPVHVLVLNQMLAELAGAPRVLEPIDFLVPAEDSRHIGSLLSSAQIKDFVILNPGGGWPTKRWDPLHYGSLARRIRDTLGMPVVVTTGPGEENLYAVIARSCGEPWPHHFPVSFLQLIPLLKKARLFVGGDTGPFHLACALATPVVGIFGPTSPARNGPWNNGETVVQHVLKCSPCYGRTCPTKNECMNIGADEVYSAVIRRLGNQGGSTVARD
jgi:lipopolysaccharide heptosyltransferase I